MGIKTQMKVKGKIVKQHLNELARIDRSIRKEINALSTNRKLLVDFNSKKLVDTLVKFRNETTLGIDDSKNVQRIKLYLEEANKRRASVNDSFASRLKDVDELIEGYQKQLTWIQKELLKPLDTEVRKALEKREKFVSKKRLYMYPNKQARIASMKRLFDR